MATPWSLEDPQDEPKLSICGPLFRKEHATCLQGLLTCKTCADGDPSIALAKAAQGLMSGI